MRIRNVRHKGLKRLIVNDDRSGVPADTVDKLRRMIAFLQDMATEDELKTIPTWKAHQLTGGRKGLEPARYQELAADFRH